MRKKILGALRDAKNAHPEIEYHGFEGSISKRIYGEIKNFHCAVMTPEQLKALMDWVRHAASYEADLVVNPGSDFNSGADERVARNTLYKAFGFVGTSSYIDPGEPKYCDESN